MCATAPSRSGPWSALNAAGYRRQGKRPGTVKRYVRPIKASATAAEASGRSPELSRKIVEAVGAPEVLILRGQLGSHAAVTASSHWVVASARKLRSVDREIRWR